MVHRIREILAPPVFKDENQTRKAKLLNAMLLIILVSILAGTFVLIFLNPASVTSTLTMVTPIIVAVGGLLHLVRRGRLDLASALLAATLLIAVTGNNWMYRGTRGLTSAYFLVVAVASLLLSERATLIFCGLCLLAMAGVYIVEVVGVIHGPGRADPYEVEGR